MRCIVSARIDWRSTGADTSIGGAKTRAALDAARATSIGRGRHPTKSGCRGSIRVGRAIRAPRPPESPGQRDRRRNDDATGDPVFVVFYVAQQAMYELADAEADEREHAR